MMFMQSGPFVAAIGGPPRCMTDNMSNAGVFASQSLNNPVFAEE